MKSLRVVFVVILVHLAALQATSAASVLKIVALPHGEGGVVGAAFSPDSSRLALIRHSATTGTPGQRFTVQIVDLKSDQVLAHADVLKGEPVELASSAHYISYSSDGHHLLLVTSGSDRVSILDAADLRTLKQFVLHPEVDSRMPTEGGYRYFKGVVSLAVASGADAFGVLAHDELSDNEVILCSVASGRIVRKWSLGRGGTTTQIGHTSLSLSGDGSMVAVSLLPQGSRFPRGFNNLYLFGTASGSGLKSIRTAGLVGPIMLIPGENLIASRIDTPGFLAKKACIEEWSFETRTIVRRFCDHGRDVSAVLGGSLAQNRVVGFASHMRKSIEGLVYAVSGRVDVWDMRSGSLVASSSEIPRLVPFLQVSNNGEWIIAGQNLFRLGPVQ